VSNVFWKNRHKYKVGKNPFGIDLARNSSIMNVKSISSLFIIAAACGIVVSTAHADDLQYVSMQLHNADTLYVQLGNNDKEHVYAGKILFNDLTTHSDVATICADMTSTLDGSSHDYSKSNTNGFGTSAIDLAGKIVAENYVGAVTADEQEGLQLAVWSAIYNGGGSLNLSGNFKATGYSSAGKAYAEQDFSDSLGTHGSSTYFKTTSDCGGQSQLGYQPVPAPSSYLMLGLGVIGVAIRRKRA